MGNVVPICKDLTTGQRRPLTPADSLTKSDGSAPVSIPAQNVYALGNTSSSGSGSGSGSATLATLGRNSNIDFITSGDGQLVTAILVFTNSSGGSGTASANVSPSLTGSAGNVTVPNGESVIYTIAGVTLSNPNYSLAINTSVTMSYTYTFNVTSVHR